MLDRAIAVRAGETVERDGFAYADLLQDGPRGGAKAVPNS
jgi:hypothetical protein